MDKSMAQGGTGLIVVDAPLSAAGMTAFLDGLAKHRHFGRETDPPLV
jgi:catalase